MNKKKEKCKFCGSENNTIVNPPIDDKNDKSENDYICLECASKQKKYE